MKKLSLFTLLAAAFVFFGCEKNYDSIVDQSSAVYQVSSVRQIDSVRYIPGDSLLLISISFLISDYIKDVYTNIYSSTGNKLNSSSFRLFDNGNPQNGDIAAGDNTFSNKFPLSQYYPNGVYKIDYFVQDKNNFVKRVAVQNFKYDNGQTNIAPVISNLVAPDSAKLDTIKTLIFLSVKAEDANGQEDIELVYFNSFIPPNGNPSSGNPFIMFDNGMNGDQTANDGIYSLIVELPPSGIVLGTYRWEFEARDRGKKLSNKIIHNIVIFR